MLHSLLIIKQIGKKPANTSWLYSKIFIVSPSRPGRQSMKKLVKLECDTHTYMSFILVTQTACKTWWVLLPVGLAWNHLFPCSMVNPCGHTKFYLKVKIKVVQCLKCAENIPIAWIQVVTCLSVVPASRIISMKTATISGLCHYPFGWICGFQDPIMKMKWNRSCIIAQTQRLKGKQKRR